jgi:pilus assembly protein Flp/PilA
MTRFLKDHRGVTVIEYALIAALVAIAAVSVITTLGHSISSEFSKVNAAMSPVKGNAI